MTKLLRSSTMSANRSRSEMCHTSNRLNQFTYRIMTIRWLSVNLVRWTVLKITLTFDECLWISFLSDLMIVRGEIKMIMWRFALTRCPVDCLNWHPRFVNVDFIRMQNERSKPLYLLFDCTDIDDDTGRFKFPFESVDEWHWQCNRKSHHLDSSFHVSFHRPKTTATPFPANAPLDSAPTVRPPPHDRLDGRNQIYCCQPFQPEKCGSSE